MAGRPLTRARKEQGLQTSFSDKAVSLKSTIIDNMDNVVDGVIKSALGIWYEVEDKDGKKKIYKKLPNIIACINLMDRVMGVARVEPNPVADRLDNARAGYLELQIAHDLVASQKKELEARGDKARIEVEMWPKQFVTEEEEASNIQTLAAEVNKALLSMTPEQFAEIITGRDPAAALEELKGRVGRDQAEIVAAVMKYKDTRVREGQEDFDDE